MLTKQDLKIGSVVRLAGGSPKLTVEGFTTNGDTRLVGYSDSLGIYRASVHPACLVFPRPRPEDDFQADD